MPTLQQSLFAVLIERVIPESYRTDDKDSYDKMFLLCAANITMIVIAVFSTIQFGIFYGAVSAHVIIGLIFILNGLTNILLVRLGATLIVVGSIFISVIGCEFFAFIIIDGGIKSYFVAATSIPVLLAILVLRRRAGLMLAVITFVFLIGVATAQMNGVAFRFEYSDRWDIFMSGFMNTAAVVVILLLGLVFHHRVETATKKLLNEKARVEQKNAETTEINRQLQEANTEIMRQRDILEEQATEIEITNTTLHEINLELEKQQEILGMQARNIEQANLALQEKNTLLTQLNIEKNEFLGIAAHDLKSPLAGIMMSASHLRRHYDHLSATDRNTALRRIEHVASMMNTIIVNLLDINAIESGQLQIHSLPQPINAIVATVIEYLQPNAVAKNIQIQTDMPSQDVIVNVDAALMTEAVQNLLSNAVKYSPLGKQIFVRIARLDASVRVEVQDEGPGLTAEDKSKLFGKFTRLSAKPTGGEHSTGLGLSIVKRLVEAMNGTVWCESERGQGATFIIELAAVSAEDVHGLFG